MSAEPFFIVSSGRSGTAMLHKALSQLPDVEMHHEYMVHIVQPLGVRRYLGLIDGAEARRTLATVHGAAVRYSTAGHWANSSNKLSWLVDDLAALFPRARFVHLVRDGRKVASSYFRKLGAECYDDCSTEILQAHYDNSAVPAPPPEKKYWWPVPRRGAPDARAFRSYNQFERIAWHWAEINRVALNSFGRLAPGRKHFARLEDLRADRGRLRALYEFLNLPYRDGHFELFARPHNVNRPEDRMLTADERVRFDRIAGPTMAALGYDARAEYVVNY